MTPNQELYAKALELAVSLLGNTTITGTENQSTFNRRFQNYHNLAILIGRDILNDPLLSLP
jgi:hypothetical protein